MKTHNSGHRMSLALLKVFLLQQNRGKIWLASIAPIIDCTSIWTKTNHWNNGLSHTCRCLPKSCWKCSGFQFFSDTTGESPIPLAAAAWVLVSETWTWMNEQKFDAVRGTTTKCQTKCDKVTNIVLHSSTISLESEHRTHECTECEKQFCVKFCNLCWPVGENFLPSETPLYRLPRHLIRPNASRTRNWIISTQPW